MKDHIIIYSHGFDVQKDARGMFTDIANALPNVQHIMFDYNEIDEANNTLTAVSLEKQAEKLTEIYEKTISENPNATIDLICHSQGCTATGLAKLNARKTILLAPKMNNTHGSLRRLVETRPGTTEKNGVTYWPRRDGSTTIIDQDYWQSYDNLKNTDELYNKLASITKLSIVVATQDEVLGKVDCSNIDKNISIIEIDSDHDFNGEARQKMIEIVKEILQ